LGAKNKLFGVGAKKLLFGVDAKKEASLTGCQKRSYSDWVPEKATLIGCKK
jgi:hypothetical protein